MNIILMPTGEVKPYPKNAKAHPPEQVAAIAKSIKEFGFDQPIVVDKTLTIIKGHGRWLAAQKLGYAQVPVVVKDVSARDARLLRLLDNHTQSREWDSQALRAELLELKAAGALDLTLFTDDLIPEGATFEVSGNVTDFSLETAHACPACKYEW